MTPLFERVGSWFAINEKYYPKYRKWLEANVGNQYHGWLNTGPQFEIYGRFLHSWMMFDRGEDALAFKLAFLEDFT